MSGMVQQSALTATMAEQDEFHNGMQQLAQHNAATHYTQDQYAFDSSGYPLSGANSAYSTPEPGHLVLDQYGRGYNGPYVNHYEEVLESQTVSSSSSPRR